MYVPDYVVQAIHEDRIRDAQRYARNRTLREMSEPIPTETGLLVQIKQWLHRQPSQPIETQQEAADARRAHAI